MSPEETSTRIKRAALSRFVEVGFGSATIDDIAAEAGVGVASLYRRWPDKAAIANELMIEHLGVMDDLTAPLDGGTKKARFLALWGRLWEQAEADPELLLFVEAQAHAGFMTEDVAQRKAEAMEGWLHRIGDFGVGADPATATSMMVGTLTAIHRGGLEVDRDDLGERLWAALRQP